MKFKSIVMIGSALLSASLLATAQTDGDVAKVSLPELEALGPLPESREIIQLEPKEHNPFAVREEPKAVNATEADAESEESKIRKVLNSLDLRGKTEEDGKVKKVMLGSLILEEGTILKHLVPGQVNLLRVSKIDHRVLEISWIEPEDSVGQRKFIKPLIFNADKVRMKSYTGSPEGEEHYHLSNGKGRGKFGRCGRRSRHSSGGKSLRHGEHRG
jgi:hypothetical protein